MAFRRKYNFLYGRQGRSGSVSVFLFFFFFWKHIHLSYMENGFGGYHGCIMVGQCSQTTRGRLNFFLPRSFFWTARFVHISLHRILGYFSGAVWLRICSTVSETNLLLFASLLCLNSLGVMEYRRLHT